MHNYKELKVWQKARELVKFIYDLTKKYPKEKIYYLTSQVRRAAISIPSNIAEGAGHFSDKEFSRFLEIAYASSCELDTQIILSYDLDFINQSELANSSEKIDELQKMISGLIKSLQKKD
jgi:four helix bundle protein